MHTQFPPRTVQGPPPVGKELEFWAANQLLNYQSGRPRVSLDDLVAGSPGGIGSVLLDPEDELFQASHPIPRAFANLIAQMDNVEEELRDSAVTLVRNPAELRKCLEDGKKFLFHCVEGAFGLGGDPNNVAVLARRGVAYVIVAHLFFRGVATCANAIPFLPDVIFNDVLNRQPNVGLTPLGFEVVERLFQERVLVDITHCSDLAKKDIFKIAADYPGQPVISSHTGVRERSEYPLNLSDEQIQQISNLGGVIGVILFPHWLRQPDEQLGGRDGFPLVFDTIDHVRQVTGNYDHIAIGSDLDGFIRPLHACQNYAETPALVAAIEAKYGTATAEKILFRNALDVLERGWKGAP